MPVCKNCAHGSYHGNTAQCPTCGEPNPDKKKPGEPGSQGTGEPPASPSMADQRGEERPAAAVGATGDDAAGRGKGSRDGAQHQERVKTWKKSWNRLQRSRTS